MDYKEIPLNANISPPDERDYTIAHLLSDESTSLPTEFQIEYKGSVKNQMSIGSCVAHSLSYCREVIEEQQSNEFQYFSTGYIYANRRPTDHQGEGMYPREALKCLQDYGDVRESLFPFNNTYPIVKEKLQNNLDYLNENAKPHCISAYCRLYSNTDIKTALYKLGPVTASYPIYESFYNTIADGIVSTPNPREDYFGNHMLTILGWKLIKGKEYWIVLNSWGKWWGNAGYCYIEPAFKATEYWSITDEILPVDPKKKEGVSSEMLLEKLIFTLNDCYKANKQIKPTGIMVHSTGANNPYLKRYVGPDDGKLGYNSIGNHWNRSGTDACVHAFIGKDKEGTVRVYQVLPWNWRAWHSGGSANNTHISFEICEDNLKDANYFWEVYSAAARLCAMLCKMYSIPASKVICHSEGYKLGIASNHGDVMHWFPKFGTNMDKFRADVQRLIEEDDDDMITDEQFATLMNTYLKNLSKKQPESWSKDYRNWAEKTGVITGDETGNKQYMSFCTREQMVTFLKRVYDLIKAGK